MSFKLVKQSLMSITGKGRSRPSSLPRKSDGKSFQVLFKKDIPNILSRFPTAFLTCWTCFNSTYFFPQENLCQTQGEIYQLSPTVQPWSLHQNSTGRKLTVPLPGILSMRLLFFVAVVFFYSEYIIYFAKKKGLQHVTTLHNMGKGWVTLVSYDLWPCLSAAEFMPWCTPKRNPKTKRFRTLNQNRKKGKPAAFNSAKLLSKFHRFFMDWFSSKGWKWISQSSSDLGWADIGALHGDSICVKQISRKQKLVTKMKSDVWNNNEQVICVTCGCFFGCLLKKGVFVSQICQGFFFHRGIGPSRRTRIYFDGDESSVLPSNPGISKGKLMNFRPTKNPTESSHIWSLTKKRKTMRKVSYSCFSKLFRIILVDVVHVLQPCFAVKLQDLHQGGQNSSGSFPERKLSFQVFQVFQGLQTQSLQSLLWFLPTFGRFGPTFGPCRSLFFGV